MLQMCSIKVLVAHSDPFISAGLAAILGKREDLEVVVAGPTAAVSRGITLCSPSADVVVADYESGLRLAASLGQWKDRVVIFTSNDREAKICRALEQGVRGYVLYGCGPHDLVDSIRRVHFGGTALGPLVAQRVVERIGHQALTMREGEILEQITLGLRNKEIAAKLQLSVGTVKSHAKSIFRKLKAVSRTEAVAIAGRRGMLQELSGPSHRDVRKSRYGARAGAD